MPINQDPWLVTDERLPCLVLAGRVVPSTSADGLRRALAARTTQVTNVYNRVAHALNDQCSCVVCIKNDGEIGFINFENKHLADETNVFDRYVRTFDEARAKIAETIRIAAIDCEVKVETISMEVTGRRPN